MNLNVHIVNNSRFSLLVVFIFTFSFLYWLNLTNINLIVFPYRDLAADMLLANKAKSSILLSGHYSRFGFNHPGPFFFYINILFENILIPFHYSRYATWLLAALFTYSIFITIAIKFILKFIDKNNSLFHGIILAIIFITFYSNILSDDHYPYLWMPSKVTTSFLLFILTLPFIAVRQYQYLPLSFLFLGICIHGYIVMPIMTLPILFIVFLVSFYLSKKPIKKKDYQTIYVSVLIGCLFASPLFIDLFINYSNIHDSNLYKILGVFSRDLPHSTLLETVNFVQEFYSPFIENTPSLVLIVIGICLFQKNSLAVKKYFFILLLVSLVITIIFFFFYYNAPKPLAEFMGRYYYSVPLSLYAMLIFMIFLPKKNQSATAIQVISLLLILYLSYSTTTQAPKFIQSLNIKKLADQIMVHTQNTKVAYIDYEEHMLWPEMAGILLELKKRGYRSCTTWRQMSFLYTKEAVCKKGSIGNIFLVRKNNCDNECLFKGNKYGLIRPDYFIDTNAISIPFTKNNIFLGWSAPEPTHMWSRNNSSAIQFRIRDKHSIKGLLRLHIRTLGRQEIKLTINEKYIGSQIVNELDVYLNFKFNPSILSMENINTIKFEFPDAHKPNNGDPRILAMALKSFSID